MKIPKIDSTDKVKNIIVTYLKEVGVPAHVKGYHYLKEAIELELNNPLIIEGMTTKLYPTIAKSWDTTPSRVERAIRHAVELGFDRCSPDVLEAYFSNTIDPQKGKPSNIEFIATLTELIRMEVEAYD